MKRSAKMVSILCLLIVSVIGFGTTDAFAEIIIDNGGAGTSSTGAWKVASSPNPYGIDSLWSTRSSTYTWKADLQIGTYDVYMWWTSASDRATDAPVQITHSSGTQTIKINQQQNGGKWNYLGTFSFGTTGTVQISGTGSKSITVCADAVKFTPLSGETNRPPAAQDDTATTIEETPVTINVLANDTDPDGNIDPSTVTITDAPVNGTAVAQSDGRIVYTPKTGFTGTDKFNYTVKDTEAAVSNEATVSVTVNPASSPTETIIDNGSSGTSYTGEWLVSGASGYYGSDSVWSRDGATYTWTFTPQTSGTYDISMWWTEWPSRSTNIPVDIQHAGGTKRVYINQLQNGAKWNLLGSFSYSAGVKYNVTITSQPGPSSTCADAVKFAPASGDTPPPPAQTTEQIFFAPGYSPRNGMPIMIAMLESMGATLNNGVWTYVNNEQNKKYLIYPVDTIQKWTNALRTEGAHVLYSGHSNYGLGQVFATNTEFSKQIIEDIYYIDDDRIVNTSSPWISVSVNGMRTGQAYPFWWPVFKDGTSGIMPYDFGDPRGDPAYNYFPTYRVPEDSKYYKIESPHNSAIVRFPDSPNPAWYSSTGQKPDSSNADDKKYFIRNTESWTPTVEVAGDWIVSRGVSGYFKEDYLYTPAGEGKKGVRWYFSIPGSENYNISAWWTASSLRTSGAPYTINHAGGSSTVHVDQRSDGGKWNLLGKFSFNTGKYSVLLTDLADPGNVVADAIRISHPNNPADLIHTNFHAEIRSGLAPMRVNFRATDTGDVLTWYWDFGDGTKRYSDATASHNYTKPGTYTVSLTVTGPMGKVTKTKTGYITAGSTSPPLQAEFSPPSTDLRGGPVPLTVGFTDLSSGNISSWAWDFGDGAKSTSQNPSHTYSATGNYTVTLTVADSEGNKSTETKENVIRAVVYEKKIDNVDYPKRHYGSKTILFRKDLEVPKEELKYARMFYGGCSSAIYYSDTFNQGMFFYATDGTYDAEIAMSEYLRAYMTGKSDYEIWQILQSIEPLYDYYDFSKTPAQQ